MIKINNKVVLFVLTVLSFCSSCIHNAPKALDEQIGSFPPQLITIEETDSEKVLRFSDFADSLSFIPLEDCHDAIISSADKVEVSKNGDYLIFDFKLKKLVRFDSLGNFLNKIGELGHGPNELIDPITFTYNPFTDHVFVNDNGRLSLMEYDLNGNLIRSKNPIPFYADEIGIVDANHYCFYSDFASENTGYNYHITDTVFCPIGCFEPFQTMPPSRVFSNVFLNSQEGLISKSPCSNYLYRVYADSVTPLYEIEHKGVDNWLSEKDASLLRNKYGAGHFSYCSKTYIVKNYVIIENNITSGFGPCKYEMSVYDIKTQVVISGYNCQNDLIQYYPANSIIHSTHDNMCR